MKTSIVLTAFLVSLASAASTSGQLQASEKRLHERRPVAEDVDIPEVIELDAAYDANEDDEDEYATATASASSMPTGAAESEKKKAKSRVWVAVSSALLGAFIAHYMGW